MSLRGSKATEAISRNSKFILRNSRICLGILDFYLKFPTMSSSGLTRGSLFCDEIPQSSWGMTKKVKSGYDTRLGNFRIPR